MTGPVEVWRGGVNTWECDEMGHLNVRFYVAKWVEALGATAHAAGLGRAFARGSGSTLVPLDQHIRFLAEARAGAPLWMTGGVLSVGESEATFLHEMRHADGRPAAAFTTRVAHVESRSGRPFPWSQRAVEALKALTCRAPDHASPRSIDPSRTPGEASMAAADRLGVAIIGRAMVNASDTDLLGRMRPELFIGRVSDSVPNLFARWGEDETKAAERSDRQGGAVLEYRLVYRRWPEAGDLICVRSGLSEVGEKTRRLVHWLLDPVSGEAWATAEAVAVVFDLKTRKVIAPSPEERLALSKRVVAGLAI